MSKKIKTRGEGEYLVVCGDVRHKLNADNDRQAIILTINERQPTRFGLFLTVKKGEEFPHYYKSEEVLRDLDLVGEFK